ncbi:MAG: hypothetical protein ACM3Q2_09650 [Syntrophothermus sp.]
MWFKFFKKKEEEQQEPQDTMSQMQELQKEAKSLGVEGEVYAVIGLALHMYMQDAHDYEKMVLTMQRVMRPYSPWSSKIYGLRQYPR